MITIQDVLRKQRAARAQGTIGPFGHLRGSSHLAEKWPERTGLAGFLRDGIWEGRRCFIVGGGQSLRGFDWGKLKGELTIAVNRAFEYFEPTLLISHDRRFWENAAKGHGFKQGERVRERYLATKAPKLLLNSSGLSVGIPGDVITIPYIGREGLSWSLDKGLCGGGNSGYTALNLALVLGADPIYLLGFDMQSDSAPKQSWFHPGYETVQADSVYKGFRGAFEKVAGEIKQKGRTVINLCADSALTCFPRADLEKDFPSPIKRPLAVSFYTKGNRYKEEADRLRESLIRFSYEHEIEEVENRGDWDLNVRIKPEFILEKLCEHPDRDILWLDADTVTRRYPALLDDPEFDIGVHIIEWADYGRTARKQLAGGMLFFKNSPEVIDFVTRWLDYVEKTPPSVWDIECLQKVLDEYAADVHRPSLQIGRLPAAYCQIFDLMKAAGEPVFEQMQASRRLRNPVQDLNVQIMERKKYEEYWRARKERSKTAIPSIDYLLEILDGADKCLDIGCGDGIVTLRLRDAGFDCTGCDVTLEGVRQYSLQDYMPRSLEKWFKECAIWDLPFHDNSFDVTFSTDLLEHVPTEMLELAIREIYRVTKKRTIHIIASFADRQYHLTVESAKWWKERFNAFSDGSVETTIMDRNEFLRERVVV